MIPISPKFIPKGQIGYKKMNEWVGIGSVCSGIIKWLMLK